MILKQMKIQNIRELSSKKPDLEALQKFNEDKNLTTWEKYLNKQNALLKQQKKKEKEDLKGNREQIQNSFMAMGELQGFINEAEKYKDEIEEMHVKLAYLKIQIKGMED